MATDVSKAAAQHKSRVSRRSFLKAAGVGSVLTATGGAVTFSASKAYAQGWDREVDVLVVGSGTALVAALIAHREGNSVAILEKGGAPGGTTALSGGWYWIPNNPRLAEAGVADPREDCLKFLAHCAYPARYNPASTSLGLDSNSLEMLESFYDNGSEMIRALEEMGALDSIQKTGPDGDKVVDYYSNTPVSSYPENKTPRGRALVPKTAQGREGNGAELVEQLMAEVTRREIPVLVEHRADKVVQNSQGQVIGVEATTPSGVVSVRARKAVIFGTGGFTHNEELRRQLRGPTFSGCGPLTNQGDFIYLATALGAKLGNMPQAWWYPQIADLAFETSATGLSGSTKGDSMIMVNKYGRRAVNEFSRYHARNQVHFVWDEVRGDYPNLVMFMIFDERVRQLFPGGTVPPLGGEAPWVVQGNTFEELAQAVSERLGNFAEHTAALKLDEDFVANLKQTVASFNGYAETGNDLEFYRGQTPTDALSFGLRRDGNDKPNMMMYPIAESGPYYCTMLVSGTLDTKAGPKINAKGQVLNVSDQPIPGLYGLGNCIASPAGEAYWAGGATLGLGMTYAYICALEAVREAVKEAT